ncbi:MAG: TIM barrel protein [Chloroflexota bacterium]
MSDDLLRFGTVGSPQTTPGTGTPAAIAHSRELGLDHLEIAWTRSVRVSDETCAEIKATAEAHNISLSVHAPYFINLNSQDAEKMRKSDERLLAAARAGYKCGARDIVFHPGSYHKQPPEEVYPVVRDQLHSIVETLQGEGVDVTLRPETMGKQAVFGTLEENLRLSVDVPGVLPCVDWAHLYARTGNGGFNSRDAFDRALDTMGEMLGAEGMGRVHFHMSGIAYTKKGEKAHIPLFTCEQHYVDLFQAFVDYDVAGTIGIEAPSPFHTADALTLQGIYRYLRDEAEGKAQPKRHAKDGQA